MAIVDQIVKSEQNFLRALKVSPGGVHSPVRAFRGVGGTPLFMQAASGAYLEDVDGNKYIDFCMSWGPLIFGHQDEEISAEVFGAMKRGWSFGTAEPYSLELAEIITENIPWVEKIRFVNSGTEAVMSALRVARAATGRNKILKFDGCYHGHADSMLVRAGSGLADMTVPDSAGVSKGTALDTVVAPLDNLEKFIEIYKANSNEIAAIIVEPIPANNGLLLQKSDCFLEMLKYAKNNGALIIFDEVITGFRTAFAGMAGMSQIKPDLVTYGKILGGGFPVGAYGGRKDLMDYVAPVGPVYQAGTLSANPVAMCAGIATLKKLLKENPYKKLELKREYLEKNIAKLTAIGVQGFSSMFWLVFNNYEKKMIRAIDQIPEFQKAKYSKLFHFLLSKGIYLPPSGLEVAFLSTVHTEEHLKMLVDHIKEYLELYQGSTEF